MGKEELSISKKIDDERLPQIIREQFAEVDAIKKQITVAREKAEAAKSKSENLHKVGKFGGGKKLAIEDLQESAKMMAEAQEQTTIAQGLFFDYQEKLAKATKWLFGVCVNNAANTQTVIRQLEIYMEGGNADDLDELKQNEINAVIAQLLQHESMQQKQEKMWEQIDSIDLELAEKTKKDKEQDDEIARQAVIDEELSKRIDEGIMKDESQDEEIARQAAVDEELGKRIDEGVKKDASQDEEIARQAAKDEELLELINKLIEANHEKDTQISELKLMCDKLTLGINNTLSLVETKDNSILNALEGKASSKGLIVSYVIGIAGLITAIIQFFI